MARIAFDSYKFQLTLLRPMLGTNPVDPTIRDTHVINRQRKLITDKSKVTKEVNKYLDAIQISDERQAEEMEKHLAKLEEIIGSPLSDDDKKIIVAKGLQGLKETFKEIEIQGVTVFFHDEAKNAPCIGDHMIYGFMKASSESLCRRTGEAKKKGEILSSNSFTCSIINQHVRCAERFITFDKDIKRDADGGPAYNQRSLRAQTAQGPRITIAKSEEMPEGAKLEFTLKVLQGSPMTQDHLETIFSYGQLTGLGQWRNAGNGMFDFTMTKI